ncbi:hypothetical protein [uncultured Microbulbifer sp.]|uniref:hypothetical protein n=1 Tax=uncultured Microbulbifer sp. TaxID=348147 RepID=UPI0026396D84|nr:hypothetical protein [uncultured Microbulbifer sp.]
MTELKPDYEPIEETQLKRSYGEGAHIIIQPILQDDVIHYWIYASILVGRRRRLAQMKTQRGNPKAFVSFQRALQWAQGMEREKIIMPEVDFDDLPLASDMDFI